MTTSTLGIDIAKNTFQLYGEDFTEQLLTTGTVHHTNQRFISQAQI